MRGVGCLEQFVTPGERSPAAFRHYSFFTSVSCSSHGSRPAAAGAGAPRELLAGDEEARPRLPCPGGAPSTAWARRQPRGQKAIWPLRRRVTEEQELTAGWCVPFGVRGPRPSPARADPAPHRRPSPSASPPAPPVCFQGRTCE